jgi:hypothetical protein
LFSSCNMDSEALLKLIRILTFFWSKCWNCFHVSCCSWCWCFRACLFSLCLLHISFGQLTNSLMLQ